MPTNREWRSVTRDHPCPSCGKPDWCAKTTEGWLKCERSTEAPSGMIRVSIKDGGAVFRPEGESKPAKRKPRASSNGAASVTYATANLAVKELERRHGPKSAHWVYQDAGGDPAMIVVRFNLPADPSKPEAKPAKSFRPVSRFDGRWIIGDPPEPLPVYHLPELLATKPGERVFIVEGERCADAMTELGFNCTTSAHGSKSAGKSDWSALAGKDVVIVPDHDQAGEGYARDVAAHLARMNPRPTVRVVRLAECWTLEEGEDIANVVADHGGDEARLKDIRESIEALAEAAKPIKPEEVPMHGAPVVLRLSDVAAEAIDWLWFGRIARGTMTMLVGRPGDGKSFATADWAARVSTGRDWPDGSTCERGSVLLVSGEDDPGRVIRPRLEAHGADLHRVHLLRGIHSIGDDGKAREVMFTLDDLAALEKALEGIDDPALIVIDPIGSFIGGRVDAHRDNEVRGVLAPLAMLAQRFNVAVVLVAHQRKSAATHADDLLLGSRAFTGIARSVLHLLRHPDDEERRLLLPGKANLCRPAAGLAFTINGEPARLVWEDRPVDLTADGVIAALAGGGGEKRSEVDDAAAWLGDLLADGAKPVKEVIREAKEAGHSERTVKRAKALIRAVARKEAFGGGWAWSLPEGCQAPPEGCHTQEVGILGTKPAEKDVNHPKDANSDSVAPLGDSVGTLGSAPPDNGHPRPGAERGDAT